MSLFQEVLAWVVPPLFVVVIIGGVYLNRGRGIAETKITDEFDQWKDWANALLVAMTVLLAFDGSMLGDASNKWAVLVDGIFGLMGVLWIVCWYSKEGFWQYKNKPVLLQLSSFFFGIQVSVFLISLVLRQIG